MDEDPGWGQSGKVAVRQGHKSKLELGRGEPGASEPAWQTRQRKLRRFRGLDTSKQG